MPAPPIFTCLNVCVAGVAAYLVKFLFAKKNPAPYPPGPSGWPLIGNALDIPKVRPWLTFTEWGKKYGDISHAEVLGQHFIVLNSLKTSIEMLDKKGSIYSDRPIFSMGGELVGLKDVVAFMPYGDTLRWNRKNFHRIMGTRTAMNAHDINITEEIETHRFLNRLHEKPGELIDHIRHTVGAVILRISHGYEVKENHDPFVDLAERGMGVLAKSTAAGAWMVDTVPSLTKIPEWMPGAGFKRLGREWRAIFAEVVSAPFQFVQDQMAAGTAVKSLASNLLENRNLSAEEEDKSKWSALSLYIAGADTTVSSIYALFLAMTLFPDVQRKAQAEIDSVVGPDRLPSFSDRDSLPYIGALVKEVLRWHAVAPVCVPHCVMEDDIHDGYYIPKGAWILANISSMLNDPQKYNNPSEFNPERFLASDGKQPEADPRAICFGFGRRVCSGSLLAEASIWISAAMTLAVFDIGKAVENGVEITPEVEPTPDPISHPKPFKCTIKPRSTKAISLIQQDTNY